MGSSFWDSLKPSLRYSATFDSLAVSRSCASRTGAAFVQLGLHARPGVSEKTIPATKMKDAASPARLSPSCLPTDGDSNGTKQTD